MSRKLPLLYSALLLTGVNLLLRLAGTSFQVYLSGRIGAAGIGLLQLTMSVGNLAMVAGMGGIRTATMYLTAEEIGKKRPHNVTWVLSGCFLYSIAFSGTVAFLLFTFAPWISENWIGNAQTVHALRLFSVFLPVVCLCGVLTGYFTAANRIGTLAMVEVAEQLCSMAMTMGLLIFWAGHDAGKACLAVILGSSLGAVLTMISLTILRIRECCRPGRPIPVRSRILQATIPLAIGDDLKTGINTVENLMVPKRLALHPETVNPLAAFGMVSGMVFPVIMFPSAILFGLTEMLIPELARCNAAGHRSRIRYLVRKGLQAAIIYAVVFCGMLYLLSEELCLALYQNDQAAKYLRWYALLVPMLYCDILTDAMTKGLGQHEICVRYNIFTSALDVIGLFLLLPQYGMEGYFLSFLLTHLINFILSLRLLLRITGQVLPLHIPCYVIAATVLGIRASSFLQIPILRISAYLLILGSSLFLTGVVTQADLRWITGLVRKNDLTKV